jgi:hypothetical protein
MRVPGVLFEALRGESKYVVFVVIPLGESSALNQRGWLGLVPRRQCCADLRVFFFFFSAVKCPACSLHSQPLAFEPLHGAHSLNPSGAKSLLIANSKSVSALRS